MKEILARLECLEARVSEIDKGAEMCLKALDRGLDALTTRISALEEKAEVFDKLLTKLQSRVDFPQKNENWKSILARLKTLEELVAVQDYLKYETPAAPETEPRVNISCGIGDWKGYVSVPAVPEHIDTVWKVNGKLYCDDECKTQREMELKVENASLRERMASARELLASMNEKNFFDVDDWRHHADNNRALHKAALELLAPDELQSKDEAK